MFLTTPRVPRLQPEQQRCKILEREEAAGARDSEDGSVAGDEAGEGVGLWYADCRAELQGRHCLHWAGEAVGGFGAEK